MTAAMARVEAAAWRARAESYFFPPGIQDDEREDEAAMYLRAAIALDAFAAGIDAVAKEREACAAIADAAAAQAETPKLRALGPEMVPFDAARVTMADQLARAIRARGAK